MKKSFLISAVVASGCIVAAQNRPPDVVFHSNCTNKPETAGPKEWFQQTRLPYGEPYLAPEKKKSLILENYSKLKLQMSLDEAEKLLGKPDFSLVIPRARLANKPEPQAQSCRIQIAYILQKSSDNMMDMEDVAVYLAFSENGKLYWAAPQNIPDLKTVGSPE